MIKIRAAKKTDLIECEKLAKTKELILSDNTYMSKEYMSHYINRNYFLVALLNEEIVGFIFGERIKDSGSLVWAITISKKHRGHSIGTLLLQEYEKRMQNTKIEWVILYGTRNNEDTGNFYKKNNYRLREKDTFSEFVKEF